MTRPLNTNKIVVPVTNRRHAPFTQEVCQKCMVMGHFESSNA
jgi:hypothetical protein